MRIYSELVEMCRECPAFTVDAWAVDVHGCAILPNREIVGVGTGFPDFCPMPEDPEYPDDKE